MVQVVGYQPVNGIPMEEYFDFPIWSKWPDEEVAVMAANGVFPPGLILQMKGGHPCVIVGKYEAPQVAERLVVK